MAGGGGGAGGTKRRRKSTSLNIKIAFEALALFLAATSILRDFSRRRNSWTVSRWMMSSRVYFLTGGGRGEWKYTQRVIYTIKPRDKFGQEDAKFGRGEKTARPARGSPLRDH